MYGLDATDVAEWNTNVRDVAFRALDSLASDGEAVGSDVPKPLPIAETSSREEQTSFHCPLCDKVTVGQRQWQEHLKSNRHRKLVKRAANGDDGPNQKRKQRKEEEADKREEEVNESSDGSSPPPTPPPMWRRRRNS